MQPLHLYLSLHALIDVDGSMQHKPLNLMSDAYSPQLMSDATAQMLQCETAMPVLRLFESS